MKHLTLLTLLAFAAPFGWGEEQNTVWYCTTDDMAGWYDGKIVRLEKIEQERFLVKTKLQSVELGEPFNEQLACRKTLCDTDCCDVEASNRTHHFNLEKDSKTFHLVQPNGSVRVGRCEKF